MRRWAILILAISIVLSACNTAHSAGSTKWSTGFWLWGDSYGYGDTTPSAEQLDVLYFQAGRIDRSTQPKDPEPWLVSTFFPRDLPNAKEYWMVIRCERQMVPDLAAASVLAKQVPNLLGTAQQRKLPVVGVQLDIDSPTSQLSKYAVFLEEVHKNLPRGTELSITALLDWFRSGTAIADVVQQVDEFVPQFYDVEASSYQGGAIAKKIDSPRWATEFNRFGKPYKVGISTFGRSHSLTRERPGRYPNFAVGFRGETMLDLARYPQFSFAASHNEAGELVLDYRVSRSVQIGNAQFDPGEGTEFVLSTPETIKAAVASARQMNGNVAGVVFFRWPLQSESLVLQPDEVLIAAGAQGAPGKPVTASGVDGGCAAVSCMDVFLENGSPLLAQPVRYKIRSSQPLEYFLPEEGIPVKLIGDDELDVALPPYCGRHRMRLGRAVASGPVKFTVEAQ